MKCNYQYCIHEAKHEVEPMKQKSGRVLQHLCQGHYLRFLRTIKPDDWENLESEILWKNYDRERKEITKGRN